MAQLELDPALNRLPEKVRTIHLIGICGTAMGSLAGMLVEKGYQVTGSDENVYPPMSDFLAGLGIPAAKGYAAANLDHRPDLVVVGNVVTRSNPESPRLKELGLPYLSLPQTLKHLFLQGKRPLVIAGTHGKTTTSSLTAWLLDSAGLDPGFMIGGILSNYGRNYRLGEGDWFVLEGDEYDTAFFDKVPKFIHYAPQVGILTSVEFDHADIYEDLEAVKAAFRRFVDLIPPDGLLIAWGDDPKVRDIAGRSRSPVRYYGLDPKADWAADRIQADGRTTRFDVLRQGRFWASFQSPLPGTHNVLNALSVIAALAEAAGLEPATIQKGLDGFKSVRRRQEVRGIAAGVTVIDDFAHHPTAVRTTLEAIRAAYPGRRLTAVFEPRTNTSRRAVFQEEYAAAFNDADRVLIREARNLDKAPENNRFDTGRLVDDLNRRGLAAQMFTQTEDLLAHIVQTAEIEDVVLIMSNGGFDNIHERLLDALGRRNPG